MAVGASGVRLGKTYVELGVRDRFSAALRSAQKQLGDYGAQVRNVGAIVAGVGASIVSGFAASSIAFAKTSSNLADLSGRTGAGVEALQELAFAGGQVGVSLEAIEAALRAQSRVLDNAAEGGDEAAKALTRLGLSAAALKGLSPERLFETLGGALSGVTDATERSALAMKVFGKSGTAILPLFSEGATGLAKMREQARKFGLVLGKDAVDAGDRLDDTLALLTATTRSFVDNVGAAVAPVFTDIAQGAAEAVASGTRFIRENQSMIVSALKVGAAITVAGGAIAALGVGLIGVSATFGAAASIIAGFGAVVTFAFTPLGVATILLAGATVALFRFTDAGEVLRTVFGEVGSVIGSVFDAIQSGDLAGSAAIAFAGVEVAWAETLLRMQVLFDKFAERVAEPLRFGLDTAQRGAAKDAGVAGNALRSLVGLGGPAFLGSLADLLDGGADAKDIAAVLDEEFDRNARNDDFLSRRAALGVGGSAVSDARARVQAARDALAAARLAAEAARFGPPESLAGSGGSSVADVADVADAVFKTIATVASRGTFNAAAVQSLQQPGLSIEREIADATKETARNTRKIADATDDGPLVFGGG